MLRDTFTAGQLADCADREVRQRKRVYEKLVLTGKLSHDKADLEIKMMTAIRDRLAAEAEANPQANGRFL